VSRPVLSVVLVLLGVAIAAVGARSLLQRHRDRRHGRLADIDRPSDPAEKLVSSRYRLVGRPDAVRRLGDGRSVPIEIKRRTSPPRGPPTSHRVQVEAYLLLLEESTGLSPPYGVLRYSDGVEFRIPWTDVERSELLDWRRAVDRPYRGEATPSPARCARCPWRNGCDARAS
jgi:CRISPR-associated exonuclease Cas4